MSTHQIVDLDAAIAEHNAIEGGAPKELQIFGRVWKLMPTITTVVVDPLMKLQQVSELINEGKISGDQATMLTINSMAHMLQVLKMLVVSEQREEFSAALDEKGDGIPITIFETLLETVMGLYSTDPLDVETAERVDPPTPVITHVLPIESGNLPAPVGERLKSESQKPGTLQVAPPSPELPSTPSAETLLDEVSWA